MEEMRSSRVANACRFVDCTRQTFESGVFPELLRRPLVWWLIVISVKRGGKKHKTSGILPPPHRLFRFHRWLQSQLQGKRQSQPDITERRMQIIKHTPQCICKETLIGGVISILIKSASYYFHERRKMSLNSAIKTKNNSQKKKKQKSLGTLRHVKPGCLPMKAWKWQRFWGTVLASPRQQALSPPKSSSPLQKKAWRQSKRETASHL